MSIFKDGLIRQGASVPTSSVYAIDQSIRFNSADSGYMHRTPSSTGNRKKFTSSSWVKFGDLTDCALPMPSVTQNANYGAFLSSGIIQFFIYYSGSWQGQLYTNRVFRDPSAWYHFVIAVDTTENVSSERVRIYVNGLRETSFSTENYPNQNQDTDWNNSGEKMGIGVNASNFNGSFGEYYAAEMHYLDGYAYGPEYFGEFNSSNIWIPKEYDGSYGTNGFHIDGRDSTDLGDDESGNGNDFTTSGLAAHDQVTDSPTNNFCVLNPLYGLTGITHRDGNLDGQGSSTTYRRTIGTQGVSSGKWYYEGYIVATTVNNPGFGWVLTNPEDWTNYSLIGTGAHEVAGIFAATGQTHVGKAYVNGTLSASYTSTTAAGDIFGIAVDFDNQGFYIHKNGTYYNSGDPTSGASKTGSLDASGMEAGAEYIPGFSSQDTNSRAHLNFGQDGTFGGRTTAGGNTDGNGIGNFKHSVPSGYLALCTRNLGS